MTYTAKLYHRIFPYYAWLRTRKEPRYTISFLLYAFALEKNRAWQVVILFFGAGPIVVFILCLLTSLIL